MNNHLAPGDHAFPEDKQLMADLSALNAQLSRYLVRYLAADALQAEPLSVSAERAPATTMATLAAKVQLRADRRTAPDAQPALEGEATLRRLTSGRPSERC
jgi:hypothetical protein